VADLKRVFFGYPSRPAVERDAIATAAKRLTEGSIADARTWESLRVSGRILVDLIESEIRAADLSVFDVTSLNQNVMYELGFAIGSDKPVWLLRDTTDRDAATRWRRLGVLSTVGYRAFTNADDIFRAFLTDRPDHNPVTIYEESIAPSLLPSSQDVLFHIPTFYDTEIDLAAERELTWRRRRGFRYVASDMRESGIQPLTWYGQQVYQAIVVVVDLMPPRRLDSELHNALAAFIAGLARGMGRQVLLVAEEEWETPIDYRDLVRVCESARSCSSYLASWLDSSLSPRTDRAGEMKSYELRLELATELAALRLGDPVAENEENTLTDYFIPTAEYREVIAPKSTLFVGRKGTGKSANLIKAADELAANARVLVGVVKPMSYEWQGLLRVLNELHDQGLKDYVVASVWEFLLLSEIALLCGAAISERPALPAPGSPEDRLQGLLRSHPEISEPSFSVRLERAMKALTNLPAGDTIENNRRNVAAALHHGPLHEIQECLPPVLAGKERVAILIDNLDKAWQRGGTEEFGPFLLGLVAAAPRVSKVLSRRDRRHRGPNVTIALFLRSDIFDQLSATSGEPDKLPVVRLGWEDPELLIRVIEERYVAFRGPGSAPDSLWHDYFCPTVRGITARSYLTWRVLPRPRDLIQFVNAILAAAVNRRHGRVEEADVLTAEAQYSQFAHSVMAIENDLESGLLEEAVFCLAGGSAVLTEAEIASAMGARWSEMLLLQLLQCQFLGIETRPGHFEHSDDPHLLARNRALGKTFAQQRGEDARYRIHPAYRPYLEISDPDFPPRSLS
jgi:hypothetical protein